MCCSEKSYFLERVRFRLADRVIRPEIFHSCVRPRTRDYPRERIPRLYAARPRSAAATAMADQEAHASRSSRARRPTERSREADEHRREQLGRLSDAALDEADVLVTMLHELEMIPQSSRPDRRTIAFAVASLRGQLPADPSAQAAEFGLHVDTLLRARAEWVDDVDARLPQAMAYQALSFDERASFVVDRPSEEQLAERAARKRQRLTEGDAYPLL